MRSTRMRSAGCRRCSRCSPRGSVVRTHRRELVRLRGVAFAADPRDGAAGQSSPETCGSAVRRVGPPAPRAGVAARRSNAAAGTRRGDPDPRRTPHRRPTDPGRRTARRCRHPGPAHGRADHPRRPPRRLPGPRTGPPCRRPRRVPPGKPAPPYRHRRRTPHPEPQLQVGYFRLDLGYEERKVGLEYDGSSHLTRDRIRHDRHRGNWLATQGWRMRHFTDTDLYRHPTRILTTLRPS
ncbi:DUF559 domain-containing protein [Catellatospora coxensis]